MMLRLFKSFSMTVLLCALIAAVGGAVVGAGYLLIQLPAWTLPWLALAMVFCLLWYGVHTTTKFK